MKKYLYIFKSELMSNISYTFDMLLGFVGYIIMIFILMTLWQYIYSDPNELINGYTMNETIWYIIITEVLWTGLQGRKLCKKICADIKEGNITYNLNKPYNYIEYILFNHLGDFIYRFIFVFIIGLLFGFIFLGSFPNITILSILGVILSCLFATIINILITTIIGLVSFFIEDAHPLYWVHSKFILILGTLFPPTFFPGIIGTIVKYSPVYASVSAPATLFVKFNLDLFLKIMIIQIFYIIILLIITHLFYRKGAKKLNVNGG